jgi:polyhydroxyalkanoate synthesis regulator phasin
MNSETLIELLQKGFRVTLGATASLIEILQDPQRRDENLNRLRLELAELAEEWAAKGEMTEREARNFVETILTQQTQSTPAGGTYTDTSTVASPPSPSTTVTVTPPTEMQADLRELTTQIAAIREELEKMRDDS